MPLSLTIRHERSIIPNMAIEMGLAVPKFSFEKPSYGKTVSAEKLMTVLGYQFTK